MDKMTPPPNYYGAPYPNQQNQNNNMYPKNPQFGTPFTPEMVPVANQNTNEYQDTGTGTTENTYYNILDAINNVDSLYEIMKNKISSNIGRKVKVYASFTDSTKWHDVVFEGTLMAIADDFMIVKNAVIYIYSRNQIILFSYSVFYNHKVICDSH